MNIQNVLGFMSAYPISTAIFCWATVVVLANHWNRYAERVIIDSFTFLVDSKERAKLEQKIIPMMGEAINKTATYPFIVVAGVATLLLIIRVSVIIFS